MQAQPSLLMPIQDLFKFSIFRVPNYQRGYAWEERQVLDLLNDLEEMEPGKTHYTGTVVVVNKDEQEHLGETYSIYDIVDGQQRLATMAIILQCLYEEYLKLGDAAICGEPADETARTVREGYIIKGNIKKLVLNKDSNDFFLNHIINAVDLEEVEKPTNTSQENLKNAKVNISEYIRGSMEGMDADSRIEYLETLRRKVTNGLIANRYVVDTDAEAGVIFEVMNDRGKPLSGADKIKNYLIYLAYKIENKELAETINNYWGDIFRNLMASRRSSEDDFLRYHWIIFTNQQKEYDVHRGIKARIRLKDEAKQRAEPEDIEKQIHVYAADLRSASDVFYEMNQPDNKGAFSDDSYKSFMQVNEIRETVERFHRLGTVASFYPLLISARRFFSNDPQTFLEILALLEIFAFRVLVVGNRRTNTGQTVFYSLAHQLYDQRHASEDERAEIAKQVKNKISQFIVDYGPDDQFVERLRSDSFYHDLQSREIKYFFYELELEEANTTPEQFTVSWDGKWGVDESATVEHILPQNPKDYEDMEEEAKEIHDSNVHRLGNLTITGCNSNLSNKPFLESPDFLGKRDVYKESVLRVQKEIGEYEKWDANEINERAESLISFALQRWPLPVVEELPAKPLDQKVRSENQQVVQSAIKKLNKDIEQDSVFKNRFFRYMGKKSEEAVAHIDFEFGGRTLTVWGDYGREGAWGSTSSPSKRVWMRSTGCTGSTS